MKTYTHHALLLLGAASASAIVIPTSEPPSAASSMAMLETRAPKAPVGDTLASLIPCPPRPAATKIPAKTRTRDTFVCTILPSEWASSGRLETRTAPPPYEDPFVCHTDAVSRSTPVTNHHQRHVRTTTTKGRMPASKTHAPYTRPYVPIEKVAPPGVTKLKRVSGGGFAGINGLGRMQERRGTVYTTEVAIGNQTFDLMVDTASHVTWIAGQDDFACSISFSDVSEKNHCGVSKRFHGKLSGGNLPGSYQFQTSSGVASVGRGVFGYENVALAGMQISHQWVAVAELVKSPTALSHSGVLGLSQVVPRQDQWLQPMGPQHTPVASRANATSPFRKTLIRRMADQNPMSSLFSLALSRQGKSSHSADSYLGLGMLAPVAIEPEFAETPMREGSCGHPRDVDTHYHITVDKFLFGKDKSSLTTWTQPINMSGSFEIDESEAYKKHPFFSVDSGAPYIALPNDLANSILDLYSPQATIREIEPMSESQFVPCDASVPVVGLEIGGQTIWLDKKDLVAPVEKTNFCEPTIMSTTHLMTGQVQGDQSFHVRNGFTYVLGTPFLHNVMAVFDIGAQTMRFAQRKAY